MVLKAPRVSLSLWALSLPEGIFWKRQNIDTPGERSLLHIYFFLSLSQIEIGESFILYIISCSVLCGCVTLTFRLFI